MPDPSPSNTMTRTPLVLDERGGAPVACDLTGAPDTPQQRLAEYGRLFAHALIGRERSADGVELHFAPKPRVAEWVADLARREAACCPFISNEVRFYTDRIVWRATSQAGKAAQSVLDELHAAPELLAAHGVDGVLARYAQAGFSITSPAR